MICNLNWKLLLTALAAAIFFILPANGQISSPASASSSRANTVKTSYDLAKEVKIEGVIERIDAVGTSAPMGTHIRIQTPQGIVDAQLGFGAAANPARLGIAEGQNVTVVGMMKTVGGSEVMLARLLTTPDQIFVLRNEHGIPARAVPNNSHFAARTEKGGL